MVEVLTWVTVACAVVGGVWLVKTAVGIKIGRRAARESGKDGIYSSPTPYVERSDPSPASYANDPTFNPDDVELVIDAPASDAVTEQQSSKL